MEGKQDFYFIERDDPEKALGVVKELCCRRLPQAFGFDPRNDVQVLTPMHRGTVGVGNLNAELQALLNPQGQAISHGDRMFRAGDRMMQTSNNYDKEVYNGDVGRIESVDEVEHKVQVSFDGRAVSNERTDLDELVLAHAVPFCLGGLCTVGTIYKCDLTHMLKRATDEVTFHTPTRGTTQKAPA